MGEREISDTHLPTFIVIGPGRSGTSWMYEMLRSHPEVCMAKNTKETLFFDREWHRGASWYRSFFDHCSTAIARGEVCNTYLYNKEVPSRMKSLVPEAILITCLRNPYERLRSAYEYRIRSGEAQGSFSAVVREQPDLLAQGLYAKQLGAYYEHFPRTQVRILFYDDLQEDPLRFLEYLYSAIGVDSSFVPEHATQRINPTSRPRFAGTARILGGAARSLRHIGARKILDQLKRTNWVRRALLVETESASYHIDGSLAEQLRSAYSPDIRQIEQWTGRNLQLWNQP